jgi:hypothetical protein
MTTPSGKLAWGQAGSYDAIDDRSVISAVTRNQVGLLGIPAVTALSGLQLKLAAGWLAVVACGDGTSAVVGSRLDQTVTANAGPASGTRTDSLWCDVQPDSGTWSLTVITQTAEAGRTGLRLATLTVPANATLASQMTIAPVDPVLTRRLLSMMSRTDTANYTSTTWGGSIGQQLESGPVTMVPGTWYRVRYDASSTKLVTPPAGLTVCEGRIGIGTRVQGSAASSAVEQRAAAIPWITQSALSASVEWVFRHPLTDTVFNRIFVGRIWSTLGATYQTGNASSEGYHQQITVEDLST